MSDPIFEFLRQVDSFIWDYVAFVLIILLGCCLTIHARAFQIRALPSIIRSFIQLFTQPSDPHQRGVHPLRAFFASVGGMIGIGNVVGIVTAVQIGGPGALIWVWVAAFVGTIVKYSEIFLGLKYRVKNEQGGYDGGPMYFLQQAFKSRWLPPVMALLLCIYGVEIYQFAVVTDSLSANLGFYRPFVIVILLTLVIYASIGGIARVGRICSWVMPFFVSVYMLMGMWIIASEAALLPEVLHNAFISAFTGHAAVGGFAGSTVLLAIQHGIARAAYSGDIGIGYDSIIQSESSTVYPERQARLAILGVCIDNIICTVSILIVLLSGVWSAVDPIQGSLLVQTALSNYFPYMHIFMPLFLFIAGYTTMIAYFCVGIKCARFLNPRYGASAYLTYAVSAWIFFSFFDQSQAMLVMSLAGAMLLVTNLIGIFLLRHEIVFTQQENKGEIIATASATESQIAL